MSARTVPLILLGVTSILVFALSALNGGAVTFSLFGASLSVSEGVLLGISYVLGVIGTLPLFYARVASKAASEQKLVEWQQQDNKLAQQVQSDKEKQLEAKIATLEAALQKALQRK